MGIACQNRAMFVDVYTHQDIDCRAPMTFPTSCLSRKIMLVDEVVPVDVIFDLFRQNFNISKNGCDR
jgi:hypothetical protein